MRPVLAFAVFCTLALALPATFSSNVEASHALRIVMPYGQNERLVPVVAGYEVAPRPLGCDVGTVTPTRVLYSQDFEGDVSDVKFSKDIVTVASHAGSFTNLWHVTHAITNEKGTDAGHSGTGKLYFGRDATGKMGSGQRLAGLASFPAFTIPTEPSFLTWNDKFEVEGLFGYDHLWVEVQDVATGQVFLLCSTDTDVRPDKSSSDNEFSTCSPYRTMLCPTGIQGAGGLDYAPCPLIGPCFPTGIGSCLGVCTPLSDFDFGDSGLNQIDPTAPHWEARYVQLPVELLGRTVVPRFMFDTADGVANGYLGWMGDDFRVVTGIPNPEPYPYFPRS